MNRRCQCFGSLLLGLLLSSAAPAAVFCVDTSAEFLAALETAADSPEDDTIRVVGTTLTLPEVTTTYPQGALAIRGGYAPACPDARNPASFSSLLGAGTGRLGFQLYDGDLTLERLQFSDMTGVSVLPASFSHPSRVGQILVQRCAFLANQSGLLISTVGHDVRIENSLFIGSQANGGNIFNGAGLSVGRSVSATADLDITVINSTAFGNKNGIVFGSTYAGFTPPQVINTISFNNRARDLTLRQPVVLENSLWISEDFAFGGVAHPSSSGNLQVDPQLDGNYRPLEPGSPMIDSGSDFPPGGLPSRDHAGGVRRVGVRVDRGAYESSISSVPVLTVTSTASSGPGTLRQAILDANADPDENRIVFSLPVACPAILSLVSALPPLTAPATIAGETQAGSRETLHPRLFDATACVVLSGSGNLATGLEFATTSAGQHMSVSGLVFYGFTSEAVRISGPGRGIVRGNTFGTGAPIVAQGFADAVIRVEDAPGTLIGGRSPDARNVITRGAVSGIHLLDSDAGRSVVGNSIGLALSGNSALANGTGVLVAGGEEDRIERNYIGFNSGRGIRIVAGASPAGQTLITHNGLGIAPGRASAGEDPEDAGNGSNAVRIENGTGHRILENDIRFNDADALVVLTASRRVEIARNRISRNTGQGIDLSPDGINPIDNDVGATGANDGLNFPTLFLAEGDANLGIVYGTLQSRNGTFRIELFANASCDANGFGEAELPIGSGTVQIGDATAANGSAAFQIEVRDGDYGLLGSAITAIAIDADGNSSEISGCRAYTPGPEIFSDGFEQ
jgi:hypothetical protein